MTVRELVLLLRTCDPDRPAVVYDRDGECIEVGEVRHVDATIYDYSGSPLDPASGYGSSRQVAAVLIVW